MIYLLILISANAMAANFTASDARYLAENGAFIKLQSEIKAKAAAGLMETTVYHSCTKTEKLLEKLGYKVTDRNWEALGCTSACYGCNISWEKPVSAPDGR